MKNIEICAFGSRDGINVEITGNDYETIFNEIESAIRKTYENSKDHGRDFGLRVSVGENHLYFGIGLNGDRSGVICWGSRHSLDRLASGKLHYRRYVNGAFWTIVSMVINHFGLDEYDADAEWENLVIEANTLNDYANELTAAVEENMTAIDGHIDSARELIKETLNDGDPVDSEEISRNAQRIKECLDLIKDAADYFIARASRLTGCDFCFEDFFNGDDLIFDFANAPVGFDLQDFCLDDVFEDILNYIFLAPSEDFDEYDAGSCTELLDLRDTLYHYLIAA